MSEGIAATNAPREGTAPAEPHAPAAPTLRVTILGCGSSGGVPRVGGDWGNCDPANPKNRRRRCALLVERHGPHGTTRVLVDTGPDLREQLLDAGVNRLDAVLYTHPHADHLHGIDDLRGLAIANKRRVPVYMDRATFARAREAFAYCFEAISAGYPPILERHELSAGRPVTVEGAGGPITATPFAQIHGTIESLGFRFGDLAYSSDLHDLPLDALPYLADLDVWIVDALWYRSHTSHFSLNDALHWIERLAPQRAILTNMHQTLDYERVSAETPTHVEPAYDRMVVELVATDSAADTTGHGT